MGRGPASAGRPRFEVADIVRQHRAGLEAHVQLTVAQRRALSAIALCRTAALGGHLDVCCSCGRQHPAYNSCRNRHCPKCQVLAQERWIAARSERILPTRYFHVVFTLPSELRALARFQPKRIYEALFHAASQTLLQLGRSRLGALLGVTIVLHTWTRELHYHPHVHAIVTAGGLALDAQRWVSSSTKYLFPVQVMGTLLRGKMLDALRDLRRRGQLDGFDGFQDPEGFDRLMAKLAACRWVVYAKKPFRRSNYVLRYLGRYTHRVAIANSRLLDVTAEHVTFRTKPGKTCTLPPVEFLARFVRHVLPPAFVKIRHYGLLAGTHVHDKLERARQLLSVPRPPAPTAPSRPSSYAELLSALTGRDPRRCPVCGGPLRRVPLPRPCSRAPP